MIPGNESLRRQRGFITYFVLGIAVAVFFLLAGAMQANHCFQQSNRRHLARVQQRAATLGRKKP